MNYEAPKARLDDLDLEEYRDPNTIAQWTVWLLYVQIAISAIAIVSGFAEHKLLLDLQASAFDTQEAASAAAAASDRRQAFVGGAQLIIFIGAGVFCLMWIHRMAFNARIRARALEYTPGWSVGWYFIPIAYWWKPYQAMKAIWEESVTQAGSEGRESSTLLGTWWTLWLIVSIIGNASFRMTMGANDIETLRIASIMNIISDAATIPLCIVFIMMVRRLTAMQEYAHQNPDAREPDMRGNW